MDVLPVTFEPNQGQSGSDARFLARGRGFSALFKQNEADLLFAHPPGTPDLIRVTLPNASSSISLAAENRLPGTVNYFNGDTPRNWHTGLPTFERLRYTGIYPGIDLIYYGSQGRLEFDFDLFPGADPRSIRLRFEGATSVELNGRGNLNITGKAGRISFQRPVSYQQTQGEGKTLVSGSFQILGKNTIGFAVADYDRSRPLIIDPILNYSTYIGSLAEGTSIAVDQNGEAYVTGLATLDFPTTPGSYQPVGTASVTAGNYWPGVGKPFVAKFNSTGTALLYSTFLSGSGIDAANGITLDASGDAFVVGTTSSMDFPITTGALQTKNKASQTTGFVTRLNSTGTSLIYSTYFGGSTWTSVNGVAVDGSGNAYLTGGTEDANFPTTPGSYETAAPVKAVGNLSSAFIAKLNPGGTALAYSTYVAGSQTDAGSAIAVNSTGEAYVGGNTTSNNFPVTAGAVQGARQANNRQAGFVTKLNASGSAPVYSTYLSGNDLDNVTSIAVDSNGNAYAAGSTNSPEFPVTAGAYQSKIGISYFGYPQTNAFVTEMNSDGTSLTYSTFLGGGISFGVDADEGDEASAIALDEQGMVYLTGTACTGDFPVTAGAFELQDLDGEVSGQCTSFLTVMNPAPNTPLVYSSYFGGTGNQNPPGDGPANGEAATGLALDPSGNVYLAGYTHSVDFPMTAGVIETPFTSASEEAFVTEFNGSELKTLPVPTVTVTSIASSVLFGQPVTFTAAIHPASGSNPPTGYVGFNFLEEELSDVGAVGTGVGFGPWTTVALNGSGVATFTTSSLQALQTPLNAFYLGDANNAPAVGSMTQTVRYFPTTTTVTSSANNVPYGTPVVFTATVLDNTGKPAKGIVFFLFGHTSFAEPELNSAGQATWTNGTGGPLLPAGTDTVTAEFFPFTGYQAGSGTLAETFTALGVTPAPSFNPPAGTYSSSQEITLSDANSAATIYYTTDGTTPVPGTSPQFLAGLPIPANASETIKALATAAGYTTSSVVSAAYTINLPPADFSLSIEPQAMTVSGGAPGNIQVNISGLNGFAQSVSLSCSGLPANATCAFVPGNITGTGVSTLTITASNRASVDVRGLGSPFGPFAAMAAVLGCVCFRRRRTGLWVLLLCTLSLMSLTACGGGSSSSTASPTSTSTVSVIGTSGSLSHSASFSLTLTQ